jgi:hypothetical protein
MGAPVVHRSVPRLVHHIGGVVLWLPTGRAREG